MSAEDLDVFVNELLEQNNDDDRTRKNRSLHR